ncbi:MAG TPA: mechanosensitive ion channel domain-containing protein [Geobacteraceae bacterium]
MSATAGKQQEAHSPTAATTELTDKEINESRATLEARIAELRLQTTPQATAAFLQTLQQIATSQELAEWEKLTAKLNDILEDHLTSLFRFENYRKAVRDKLEDLKTWKGFSEKPPYPMSLVESLRDDLDAKQSVLNSLDVIRSTIEGEFAEYSSSLKNSSKQVRLAQEELEKNTGKAGEPRSRWLLMLAQLNNEVSQAGVLYGEVRRLSAAELLKGVQADFDLITRKLAVAKVNFRFTEEELEQRIQAIDEQIAKTRQMLEQAKSIEKESRRQLDLAESAIGKSEAALAAGQRSPASLEQLVRERKRNQARFDDAATRVLVASGMVQLLKREKLIWEDRYLIAGGTGRGTSNGEATIDAKTLRHELALIAKWKGYVDNKLNVIKLQLKSQQETLAAVNLSAVERDDARFYSSLYREQETLLLNGLQFLDNYEKQVQRCEEDAKLRQVSLVERARAVFADLASLAGKIWSTELYVAEETLIVDNKKIVRPRSVTVGKVLQAILILFVGVTVIRRLKKPLRRLIMHRLKLGENDSQIYTRLLTYVLFIGVLVSALIFVNIPLAIFTFFGGALAIGIGFGAQTLFNNFISGLILMFDRTISMGDMVEVDGHRGRVASIGMRSSSIKRFDGVEMLVPNSVFLQQNVINWTSSDPRARYTISVGVAYGSPTRVVEQVILKAVTEQPEVLSEPAPYVVFDNFADSSLNFTTYLWIELDPELNSLVVFSDIRHRINERLADAGIAIPFPQRDLHLSTSQPLEIKVSGPN